MTEFPACRHIHTAGRRCGSPAMRNNPYCFFHHRTRRRHQMPPAPSPTQTIETVLHPTRAESAQFCHPEHREGPVSPALILDFPVLEDRESIQVAASMIVAALGRNQLEPRRAASMLYGLQVATAVTRDDVDADEVYYMETDATSAPDGADLALETPHPTATC